MTCKVLRDDNGRLLIQCSRGSMDQCEVCGKKATQLCDFPLTGKKTGQTCDKKLCESCAVKVKESSELGKAPEKGAFDFCPAHARSLQNAKVKPAIHEEDINGVGTGGYLSVRRLSHSETILRRLVQAGIAKEDRYGNQQFRNAYCVKFPSHFRTHVDVKSGR